MVNYKQKNLFEVVFDGQDLTDSVFDRCNLHKCSFKNCIMNNVTIDRCNCIACDFTGANLEDANIINSNFIDEEEESRFGHPMHEDEPENISSEPQE